MQKRLKSALIPLLVSAILMLGSTSSQARLFDVSRGTVILASSPSQMNDSPLELFGLVPGTHPELGNLIFADGSPVGTVHFVEWEMPQETTVGRLRFDAGSDLCTSTKRTFDKITVLAELGGEMTTILEEEVPVPYDYDVHCSIVRSFAIPLTTASRFRVEFRQALTQLLGGPRIYDVKGFRYARCGDPSDDDKVSASDALLTLQASVGSRFCERCICDVNDDGSSSATDALAVLRNAVGTTNALGCPACRAPVTTLQGAGHGLTEPFL